MLPAQEPRGPRPRRGGAAAGGTTGGSGLTQRPDPCCVSSVFSSGCQACPEKTPPVSRCRELAGPRPGGSTTRKASHRLSSRPNARSRVWRAPGAPGSAMARDRPGNRLVARSRATGGVAGHNRDSGDVTGGPSRGAGRRTEGTVSSRQGSVAGAEMVTE